MQTIWNFITSLIEVTLKRIRSTGKFIWAIVRDNHPVIWTVLIPLIQIILFLMVDKGRSKSIVTYVASDAITVVLYMLLLALPFTSACFQVVHYRKTKQNVGRLALTYFNLILVGAVLHLIIALFSPGDDYENLSLDEPSEDSLSDRFSSLMLNSFHFSVATTTGLGYANTYPKSVRARLICDAQILTGLYIVVIGIGGIAANAKKPEDETKPPPDSTR